jgi:hypothetical protein
MDPSHCIPYPIRLILSLHTREQWHGSPRVQTPPNSNQRILGSKEPRKRLLLPRRSLIAWAHVKVIVRRSLWHPSRSKQSVHSGFCRCAEKQLHQRARRVAAARRVIPDRAGLFRSFACPGLRVQPRISTCWLRPPPTASRAPRRRHRFSQARRSEYDMDPKNHNLATA